MPRLALGLTVLVVLLSAPAAADPAPAPIPCSREAALCVAQSGGASYVFERSSGAWARISREALERRARAHVREHGDDAQAFVVRWAIEREPQTIVSLLRRAGFRPGSIRSVHYPHD